MFGNLTVIPVREDHYEFVRHLRNRQRAWFLDQDHISATQQKIYMKGHELDYFVCLMGDIPAGYIGVIDNDIRVCTHENFQGKGVGKYMLTFVHNLFPEATGRIKIENLASRKLFESCNVDYDLI